VAVKVRPPKLIPYSFIQNTDTITKQHLFNIYNYVWKSGCIPTKWRRGNTIPIPKPGKDKRSSEVYKPITILYSIAKILEIIVNNHLK